MIEILKIAVIYIITDPYTCDLNNILYKLITFGNIVLISLFLLNITEKSYKFEIVYKIFRPKIQCEMI